MIKYKYMKQREDITKKYYAYMLRCADGTLYSGYTDDLEKRIAAHNSGTGAKYTRGRRPVALVYSEEYFSKAAAMSREYRLKHLTRRQKLMLAEKYRQK